MAVELTAAFQAAIVSLITALLGMITFQITNYLKVKLGAERWRQLQEITHVAIHAAEQLGASGKIKNKFEYAKTQIKNELSKRGLDWDEEAVKAAIEASIKENFKK